MGWATHRQVGVEVPSTGDCDEGFSAAIEIKDDLPVEPPQYLLVGTWNLVEPFEYTFATRIPRGTINVEAGLKEYPVTITQGTQTCEMKFQITGIAVGDSFVLEGPCLATVGEAVHVGAKLVNGSTVEPPDGILSPPVIVADDPSEMQVRRHNGSGYVDHRVKVNDVEINNGFFKPPDEIGELKFLDKGFYEVEWTWKEKPPPDASGAPVKISRATTKVEVRLPGAACDPPLTFAGARCRLLYKTVDEAFNVDGALGTMSCNTGGGFKPNIDPDNIFQFVRQFIEDLSNIGIPIFAPMVDAEKDAVAFDVRSRVEQCILKHEMKHVEDATDPVWNFTGIHQSCDDCCCDKVPKVPDSWYNCSQRHAYLTEKICYNQEIDNTPYPREKALFRELRDDRADRAATFHCP